MKTLVLLRHGESEYNSQNRFTGWIDVNLSEKGIIEAKNAGKALKENNFEFDIAYTSVLRSYKNIVAGFGRDGQNVATCKTLMATK